MQNMQEIELKVYIANKMYYYILGIFCLLSLIKAGSTSNVETGDVKEREAENKYRNKSKYK